MVSVMSTQRAYAAAIVSGQRLCGAATIAVAAHRGLSETNLGASTGGLAERLMSVAQPTAKVLSQRALPTLRAATEPGLHGGEYFGPDGFGEQRGAPEQVKANASANDASVAKRLWEVTVALTRVPFTPLDLRGN
jgi:hypothetical protein